MKEHPDYKYRPRRKPKTLAKSPVPQVNSGVSQSQSSSPNSMKDSQAVLQQKYNFTNPLELSLSGIPHQRVANFSLPHYPPIDPTIALDLQARLQAMYAGGFYPPWRYFGCSPLISPDTPPSPTSSIGRGVNSPGLKSSPPLPLITSNISTSTLVQPPPNII